MQIIAKVNTLVLYLLLFISFDKMIQSQHCIYKEHYIYNVACSIGDYEKLKSYRNWFQSSPQGY